MALSLSEVAIEHQRRRNALSDAAAARAVRMFRQLETRNLDAGWDSLAPQMYSVIAAAQVRAAQQASSYTNTVASVTDGTVPARLVPEAFAGVTREGRAVIPELYSAVSTTKKLIGAGAGVGDAFRTGAALMSILAANVVRDAGRSADKTIATGKGFTRSVRVVSADACSRCAILAGVTGYRTDFERHPRCRCTSMPLMSDGSAPEGFFATPGEYFDSLSESEQSRVFTKAGAEAIRAGADPVKVVNARRGALTSVKRADGSYSMAQLRPVTIGRRADGSPLQVFATPEGTTARSSWARQQGLNRGIAAGDRYRRTSTLRLLPEQIMQMSTDPVRVRELLKQYGYLY